MSRHRKFYYTVIVPHSERPTAWHPTERTGRFSTLSRGAFPTKWAAEDWARKHLQGNPYSLKRFRHYSDYEGRHRKTRHARSR